MTNSGYLSITGVGVVTPVGADTEALYDCYIKKKELMSGNAEISALEKYISKKQIRRMCKLTALGLLATYRCLSHGVLDIENRLGTGIIFATGYGPAGSTFKHLDSILDYGFEMSSPLYFSMSVQNMPAANIALTLGLNCPLVTVCQFETSVYAALKTAEIWLKTGIVDEILLIGADEITQTLETCSGIVSRKHGRKTRKDFILSEGAFCIRLSLDNGDKCLGRILQLENKVSDQQSRGFRSGAYSEVLSHLECNADIYGNIPIALGFDMLIGLECLKNGNDYIQCATSDSYQNIGSVLLAK